MTTRPSRTAAAASVMRNTWSSRKPSTVRVPAVTAVMTKMPTGKVFAMMCVIRSSARSRPRRMFTIGPLPSSSIRAKPRNRQKSTVAGIIPSASDRKGFAGMNWSMRLTGVVAASCWVLKNEASIRGGNASWNEKYPITQITQNSRRIRNCLDGDCFCRVPLQASDTDNEGEGDRRQDRDLPDLDERIARRSHDRDEIAKYQPGDDPEDETNQYPGGEVQSGQSHGNFFSLQRSRWCTIGPGHRFLIR